MTKRNNRRTSNSDDPTLDGDVHWRQAAQRHYEPDRDDGLTTVIVFAIAEAEEISPIEVKSPPLYEAIDVAGIEDAFFGSDNRNASRKGTGTTIFRYTEYLIKVMSDGCVQVYEVTETEIS